MVKPFFPGKAKKALFAAIILGGASFSFLYPLLASANLFSNLLQKTAAQSDASSLALNSQTLPVLSPAVNIDPSPAVGGGDIMLVDGTALMAQEGPSGTTADIENRPSTSQISAYVVRPGDTLSGIAQMFDVTTNTIVWANDIKGGVIHPGDTLIILPITGIQHTIIKGDTLAGLAKTYRSDAHDIAQYNDLADGSPLTVGDTIIIPDGEVSGSSPAAPKETPAKKPSKPSPLQLAAEGKQTSPLRGANGPEIDGYYAWPLNGGIITQGLHGFDAVDIGAPTGTSIYASAAGTVIVAKNNGAWNGGYGNYIVIQHNNGTQTLYAHASRVFVSQGDSVSQGQLIGKVGATGEATGPHLHFEVRGAQNPFGTMAVGSRG